MYICNMSYAVYIPGYIHIECVLLYIQGRSFKDRLLCLKANHWAFFEGFSEPFGRTSYPFTAP
jgi:hypothetical protein